MCGALCILAGAAAYGCFRSAAWLLVCRLVIGLGEGLSVDYFNIGDLVKKLAARLEVEV